MSAKRVICGQTRGLCAPDKYIGVTNCSKQFKTGVKGLHAVEPDALNAAQTNTYTNSTTRTYGDVCERDARDAWLRVVL